MGSISDKMHLQQSQWILARRFSSLNTAPVPPVIFADVQCPAWPTYNSQKPFSVPASPVNMSQVTSSVSKAPDTKRTQLHPILVHLQTRMCVCMMLSGVCIRAKSHPCSLLPIYGLIISLKPL